MKYIKNLSEKDRNKLIEIDKSINYNYRERNRAKCILLSNKNYKV